MEISQAQICLVKQRFSAHLVSCVRTVRGCISIRGAQKHTSSSGASTSFRSSIAKLGAAVACLAALLIVAVAAHDRRVQAAIFGRGAQKIAKENREATKGALCRLVVGARTLFFHPTNPQKFVRRSTRLQPSKILVSSITELPLSRAIV